MIERQEGVSWDQWISLARAAEAGGFDALLRSAHYLAVSPDRRDPGTLLAKLGVTADPVSRGRIDAGLGTRHDCHPPPIQSPLELFAREVIPAIATR
jgi:alkanesulfonate monooxygenase SsuD/methylene tetrahydromethanopterin reductase-like flavin-dependent oxidoreductase (luciferase family)